MRNHLLRHRSVRPRVLVAGLAAAALLAGCGGADDDALTDARPADDVPTEQDGVTDAEPEADVPGVTEATPSDDIDTDAPDDGDTEQGAAAEVPPLLDVVDGWPETSVTIDDSVTFLAKVADEPERRQQGLMNVPELPDDVGMLFLFDDARTGGFWMKDTLVPLDIAYVLEGEIVAILQMDPCEADPCPSYDPEVEYDAALEVNQGAFSAAGIEEGSTVTWSDPVEVTAA